MHDRERARKRGAPRREVRQRGRRGRRERREATGLSKVGPFSREGPSCPLALGGSKETGALLFLVGHILLASLRNVSTGQHLAFPSQGFKRELSPPAIDITVCNESASLLDTWEAVEEGDGDSDHFLCPMVQVENALGETGSAWPSSIKSSSILPTSWASACTKQLSQWALGMRSVQDLSHL